MEVRYVIFRTNHVFVFLRFMIFTMSLLWRQECRMTDKMAQDRAETHAHSSLAHWGLGALRSGRARRSVRTALSPLTDPPSLPLVRGRGRADRPPRRTVPFQTGHRALHSSPPLCTLGAAPPLSTPHRHLGTSTLPARPEARQTGWITGSGTRAADTAPAGERAGCVRSAGAGAARGGRPCLQGSTSQ